MANTDEKTIQNKSRKLLQERDGWDEKTCIEFYEKHFNTYDKIVTDDIYTGPDVVAKSVEKYFPQNKEIKIMDLAAGTGLVGVTLKSRGFTNVDALDASASMLKLSEEKGVYTNFFVEMLSDKPTSLPSDTYDCVVLCGAFAGGHLPCSSLLEIIRITKKGGIVINVFRSSILDIPDYKDRLIPFMTELSDAGLWEELESEQFTSYNNFNKGIKSIHRVKICGTKMVNQFTAF